MTGWLGWLSLCTVLSCTLGGVEGRWANAQVVVIVVLFLLFLLAMAADFPSRRS